MKEIAGENFRNSSQRSEAHWERRDVGSNDDNDDNDDDDNDDDSDDDDDDNCYFLGVVKPSSRILNTRVISIENLRSWGVKGPCLVRPSSHWVNTRLNLFSLTFFLAVGLRRKAKVYYKFY